MHTQHPDKNNNHGYAINEDIIKGKWKEVKGGIQKMWGKLTDDELDQAQGDLKSLSGIIQRRYGESKEAVDTKLNDYFNETWGGVKSDIAKSVEKAKNAVAEATESSRQKL